jgi:hypothetical protein
MQNTSRDGGTKMSSARRRRRKMRRLPALPLLLI